MNKNLLNQIENLNEEVIDLNKRIEKLEKEPDNIIQDSVKCSSEFFPYIQHSVLIEGIDMRKQRNIKKLKRILKNKQDKVQKLINNLEYELNNIEDSEIRRIIRYKYEDGRTWINVMHKMNYESENKARMKLDRFLKKNKKK